MNNSDYGQNICDLQWATSGLSLVSEWVSSLLQFGNLCVLNRYWNPMTLDVVTGAFLALLFAKPLDLE